MLEGKRIVGVDPGTTEFFSAVDDADAKLKCCKCRVLSSHALQPKQGRARVQAPQSRQCVGGVARCYPSKPHQQRGQHPSACGVRDPLSEGGPCVPRHAPAEALTLELSHSQAELLACHGQATSRQKANRRGVFGVRASRQQMESGPMR